MCGSRRSDDHVTMAHDHAAMAQAAVANVTLCQAHAGMRHQSIGRPPRKKRFRTRSSSSSPEKYDASSHITLMMPNASARPNPRIHVKYHMSVLRTDRFERDRAAQLRIDAARVDWN